MSDPRPARLTARLFTANRVTVEVPDVPLPPPATGGRIRVDIPYPAGETARVVHRVAVINEETGFIARASVYPRVVRPGDTLSVEFGADDISPGYFGRKTMAYDLQAAATSWVAQELEERAPGEEIGYWVAMNQTDHGSEAVIYLQTPEFFESQRTPVPVEEHHVRFNTRRALERLARDYTERDLPAMDRGEGSDGQGSAR